MILKAAVQAEYSTDKGPARSANQDSFYFNGYVPPCGKALEDGLLPLRRFPMLFAVCDGMGGEKHGDEAARIAAGMLGRHQRLLKQGVEQTLNKYVDEANRAVMSLGRAGTTLVSLVLRGDRATVAHLGDSRAYVYRDGVLTQLTQDHTQQHAVCADADEPRSGVLTRHLGMALQDLVVRPTYKEVDYAAGDVFILCSDGLTESIEQVDMAKMVRLHNTAKALTDAAAELDGKDNATAIVVKVLRRG